MNEEEMDDFNEELKIAYKEGCDIVRHYSNAVRNIRTIGIAQGLVVLSAVLFLYARTENYYAAAWGAAFGLCVTNIIRSLHNNYLDNFLHQELLVKQIEKKIFRTYKPWTWQSEKRNQRWNQISLCLEKVPSRKKHHKIFRKKYYVNRAIYDLLSVFLFLLMTASLVELW